MTELTREPARQALARVLDQLRSAADTGNDVPSAELAEAVWSDFRDAVAGAVAEICDLEAQEIQHWRDVRHSGGR